MALPSALARVGVARVHGAHSQQYATNASGVGFTNEEYFEKNKQMKRPLSPHLSIYAPQMTSLMSIMTRMTGTGQTLAFSALAIGLAAGPHEFPVYAQAIADMDLAPQVAYGIKWALAFPLTYHTLNGFRHLAWDMTYGFKLKEIYGTGYIVSA